MVAGKSNAFIRLRDQPGDRLQLRRGYEALCAEAYAVASQGQVTKTEE